MFRFHTKICLLKEYSDNTPPCILYLAFELKTCALTPVVLYFLQITAGPSKIDNK